MNVLFNTYPIAFDVPGGGEIQLLKTRAAIQKRGHIVELFDPWAPKIRQANLVHYFSVFGGSSVFCNYVKQLGKPLALSPILFPHQNVEQYPMSEINHLMSIADVILPNSKIEADLLSKVFQVAPEKFQIVHNGIDDSFTKNPTFDGSLFRKHFQIDEPFLLTVANIEKRKNQLGLARALSKTDHTLVMLGNIRDQAYFDEVIKSSNGKIKYLGYLQNALDLLRSAYLACEAFVLPSVLETPGLAALEAAAMGAKIVVTEVGSTREYFDRFAQYVHPDDETGILRGIELALNSPKNNKLLEHVRTHFTWDRAATQTENGYKKIF